MTFITIISVYDFLVKYMMIASLVIAGSGVILKGLRMIRSSRYALSHRDGENNSTRIRWSPESTAWASRQFTITERLYLRFKNSLFYKNPSIMAVTVIFHLLMILVPFFIQAHAILVFQYFGIRFVWLNDRLIILMTLIVLGMTVIMLARRFMVDSVRAITGWREIGLLITVSLPFVTGLMCYFQRGEYEIMIVLHILCAQILVVMLGWSRMGHAILFMFSRLFIRGTHSLSGNAREWGRKLNE